ncbi:MAG: CsbD family protein [Candidatus Promineifilaceae bacterium]
MTKVNSEQLEAQVKQTEGAIKDRWSELRNDKLSEAKGQYERMQGQAQEKLDKATKQAKQEVSSFVDGAGQMAQEKTAEARQKVSERPMLSIAAALALGIAVGLVIRQVLPSS